ncbi:MAG: GDSL-type esterase/lipase family protein [Planctomycetota bacterium]
MREPVFHLDVLFAGSSIFENWRQADKLIDGAVTQNAAIGGTETSDWLPTLGPLIAKHRPRVFCLYIGSNDVGRGRAIDCILADTVSLLDLVREASPATKLLYFSIIRSADKVARYADLDRIEQTVRQRDASDALLDFVDINPVFFASTHADQIKYDVSRMRTDLFLGDQIHLTERAYDELSAFAAPIIAAALDASLTEHPR